MTASDHILTLRAKVGTMPLLLPSATVVVRRENLVLVGFHADHNRWLFPGGCIDPGERPADAGKREVFEETGLVVEITKLLGVFGGGDKNRVTYPNGDIVDYVTALFEARPVGGELQTDEIELDTLEWVTLDELAGRRIMPWMEEVLVSMAAGAQFDPALSLIHI